MGLSSTGKNRKSKLNTTVHIVVTQNKGMKSYKKNSQVRGISMKIGRKWWFLCFNCD